MSSVFLTGLRQVRYYRQRLRAAILSYPDYPACMLNAKEFRKDMNSLSGAKASADALPIFLQK